MKIKDIIIIAAGIIIVATLLFIKRPEQQSHKVTAEIKPAARQERVPVAAGQRQEDEGGRANLLLIKLGSEDYRESQEAAEKIFGLGKEAVPELIAALPKATLAQKGQIIFLLGRIADKRAQGALFEAVRDPNSYIRRNAVEALGKIKGAESLPVLSAGLSDEDAGVRERSAWALGEIGRPEAAGYLAGRLKDEKEERVRLTTIETLGKIRDDSATGLLLDELKSKSNQFYKDSVVKSLGQIGDSRALGGLENYLENLERNKPTEAILLSGWEKSIEEAKKAISKIGNK